MSDLDSATGTAARVVLVDDDDRFRGQLVERLAFFPGVQIVLDADGVESFFDGLAEAGDGPDVALVDIGLGDDSGIDVARRLAAAYPDTAILMLTVFEEPRTILAAIRAGAVGYLLKDAPAAEIVAAIEEVQRGGVPLARPVARQVLKLAGTVPVAPADADAGAGPEETLSPREIELLEEIVAGHTEPEIAERLCISPHTVRTHVKNIYRKLRVRSRAAAVRVTYERGLLDGDPPPG